MYRLQATDGKITLHASYRVSYATEPGDVLLREHRHTPALLVVGLAPFQRYHVLVYETPGDGGGPNELARYNGSLERKADAHGVDVVTFPLSPHDPHTCFALRVQYGEHIIVDKEEGQTTFCLPYKPIG